MWELNPSHPNTMYDFNRDYFNVKSKTDNRVDFATLATTMHYDADRTARHEKIMSVLGVGKYLTAFIVDKGHKNGDEIHTIFDNGVILIQNLKSKLVITELIARPAQIRRYWEGKSEPNYVYHICQLARENERQGRNYW